MQYMPQEAQLKLYNNTMKVRIKSLGLPKAAYGQQVDYGLSLGRGMQGDSSGSLKPKRTIGGVPREEANLEAEGGETVVGQISGDGIVDHMTIKGPRHSSGGVPMNLPDDSFIFSDTASMKIKDPQILQMFNKSKGSYTPAELAKPYDISKYKAILMDPDTDRLSRNTAEIMIKNIVMKLGALALAQEAKKGFPQGIPEISKPYMEANGISEEDLMPELKAQAEQMQAMQQQQAMQMQQAQGMQDQQMMMQQQQAPQMMPQEAMARPEQAMMDPRQMMAMQQEQQMMPPQPQQGMPMADRGIIVGDDEFIPPKYPLTEEEAARVKSGQDYKNSMFIKDNRIFNDVFRDSSKEQDRTGLGSPTPSVLSRPTQNFTPSEQLEQLKSYRSPISSVARQEAARLQQEAASAIAQPMSRVLLNRNSYGGTPMAAYGMQLGGYDMPFIMGTGGMMSYHNGGTGPGHPHGDETVETREAEKVVVFTPGGREGTTDQSGYESRTFETPGAEEGSSDYYSGPGGTEAGVAGGICKKIRESNNLEEMILEAFPAYLNKKRPGDEGYEEALAAAIEKLKSNPLYTECIQEVQDATAPTIRDEYVVPAETENTCFCKDAEGNMIEGSERTKAELGIANDDPCPADYADKYCSEEIIEEQIQEELEVEKMPLMPAEISMRRGVADIDPTSLDIIGAGERNYLDYRTAVQNDANAREKQIASIKTMPGLSIGQRQAMIANVNAQDKSAQIVTDVYNKNVTTANELAKSDEVLALNQQKMQAGLDSDYNRAIANAENQETMNVNAIRDRRQRRADDMFKMQVMQASLGNASENFDWLGNFVKGNDLQKEAAYQACVAKHGIAKCEFLRPGSTESAPTPAPTPNPAPDPNAGQPQVARYGRIVNPYIMASSVYPFNK